MLIYSEKLKRYIFKNFISEILINTKRCYLKGSFKRKIPYVTDIDIVNTVYPEINDTNIYQTVVDFLKKVDKNQKLILAYINFGFDDRFKLNDFSNQELNKIKSFLNKDEQLELENLLTKYSNDIDKKIYFITEFLYPIHNLKWTSQEIIENKKQLRQNKIVTFTDFISLDIYLVFKFFFKVKAHIVGCDFIVQYKQIRNAPFDVFKYEVQLSNYNREYYWMLYIFRKYFFTRDKETYNELYKFTELKCGIHKQMLTIIKTYQILYQYKKLTIDTAKIIIINLISSCIKLPTFREINLDLVNKIINVSKDNDANTKINLWNNLLNTLFDQINIYLNNISEKQFDFYLNKIEPSDRKYYYLE